MFSNPNYKSCINIFFGFSVKLWVNNVTFIPAAISNRIGVSSFNIGDETVASSLYKPKIVKKIIKVPTTTLSEIIKLATTPNIILKSDCEGAEYDFILHSPPKVLSKISKIIFEYHMKISNLNQVIAHLKSAGFQTTYQDLILEPNVGMAYSVRSLA